MASDVIAVYPGTFDPIHRGHSDIIRRATIAENGRLTKPFEYLSDYVGDSLLKVKN